MPPSACRGIRAKGVRRTDKSLTERGAVLNGASCCARLGGNAAHCGEAVARIRIQAAPSPTSPAGLVLPKTKPRGVVAMDLIER